MNPTGGPPPLPMDHPEPPPNLAPDPGPDALFAHWAPASPGFDEAFAAPHTPRTHWQPILSAIGGLGPDELRQRQAQIARMRHEHGASFNPFDDPGDGHAPWELDPLPLPLPPEEWRRLEKGLVQRAVLLDAILEDLYGPQRLLAAGLLPPAMVFPNPRFLRPLVGLPQPPKPFLRFYAVDVYRDPQGAWRALSDFGAHPRGLGYALENRIIISRVFSRLYHRNRILRLAPFFSRFHQLLAGAARTHRDDPHIVILSPGPASPFYFEHAFLSRYLSYPLVESQDLTVRNGGVFLKKLAGLEPVDVILRCLDDTESDPLAIRSESSLMGVAGLVQALREERVALVNPLGSGFADTPALQTVLPGVCRHLLGEELILDGATAWWCGEDAGRAHVAAHLGEVLVAGALDRNSRALADGRRLSAAEREALQQEIEAAPYACLGLAPPAPSTVPAWEAGRMTPQQAVLRFFLCAGEEGYAVMPGALVRTAGDPVHLLAGGARRQGSKDLWVLSDRPVEPFSLLKGLRSAAELHRGSDLPSRVADNLLWLGRYLERAEGLVRLVRSVTRRFVAEREWSELPELPFLAEVLRQAGALEEAGRPEEQPLDGAGLKQSLLEIAFRRERPEGLAAHLAQVQEAARRVRDRLSPDSWHVLSRLDRLFDAPEASSRETIGRAQELLDDTLFALSAFSGLSMESMTRGLGWRFMDMGRRIERGLQQVALIRSGVRRACQDPQSVLEALLEVADSLMTYRARYRSTLQLAPVLDLLLGDESNPKALGFQLRMLADHVEHLPRGQARRFSAPEERIVLRMLTAVRLADLTDLDCGPQTAGHPATTALLDELGEGFKAFAQSITSSYLTRVSQTQHFSAQEGRAVP